MKPTVPATKGASPRPLNQADLAVLIAVKRFHYLTAAQVSRLLYPDCHDDNRYARRRLARLADLNLLLRLTGPPAPRYGSAPHVFTLGRAGRQLLDSQDTYFRPAEERAKSHNFLFMDHTLATVDVLVAAELLCRTHPVMMPRLMVERELRHAPARVTLSSADKKAPRSVAVIPDAWFELSVEGRRPLAIAVELDRSTEDQKQWRAKVEALAAWASGPYRQTFEAETLTIAVVVFDGKRRETLRAWTLHELTRIGQLPLGEIFLFTSTDPVTTPPAEFFFGQRWYEAVAVEPVSLLPAPSQSAMPAVGLTGEVWSVSG